jgi:LysM repeat protein
MRARKTGRYLALLALVAVIVATALVVRVGVNTTHHDATAPKGPTVAATRRRVPKKRFYVIHSGDTLSTISVKTGVPVAQLEALNHSLVSDPNALQTGQTLRLR